MQHQSYTLHKLLLPSLIAAGTALCVHMYSAQATISDPELDPDPVIDTEFPIISTITPNPYFNTSLSFPVSNFDLSGTTVIVNDKIKPTDAFAKTTASTTGTVGPMQAGQHIIKWTATDQGDNKVSADQIINIEPIAEIEADKTVAENIGTATVSLFLNNEAPIYPVRISYTTVGTTAVDYSIFPSPITISASADRTTQIDVTLGPGNTAGQTVQINIDAVNGALKGTKTTHILTISESELTPIITLTASQNSKTTRNIISDQGLVTVNANIKDPNGATSSPFSYDWANSDNALISTNGTSNSTFEFDPSSLSSGIYRVRLTVTDSSDETSSSDLLLNIMNSSPTLLDTDDSDDDGSDDLAEGVYDDDDDGIPNYLDAISNPAWQQAWGFIPFDTSAAKKGDFIFGAINFDWELTTASSNLIFYPLLLQTSPGLQIKLGDIAFSKGHGHARVGVAEAESSLGATLPTKETSADGQVIDIEIHGLSSTGEFAFLVIPMSAPTPPSVDEDGNPEDPVFKVYDSNKTWTKFENSGNDLATATKTNGYCPPPHSASYASVADATVAIGVECIRLELEDGGENDHDGQRNGVIKFIGAPFIRGANTSDKAPDVSQPFDGTTETNVESLNKNDASSGGGSTGALSPWWLVVLISLGLIFRQKNLNNQ